MKYTLLTKQPFQNQLDLWVSGKWNNLGQFVLFKHTPKIYLMLGLNDNPITMSINKIDRVINEKGKHKGNYHGLGLSLVKKLPQALEKPLIILESSTIDDSIVVVTKLRDKYNNIIIVSIAIDGNGNIEIIDVNNTKIKRVKSNVVTSAYGKNNYKIWINKNINKIVYDKDRGIIKKKLMANGSDCQVASIHYNMIIT